MAVHYETGSFHLGEAGSRKQRTGQKQGWAVISMAYFWGDFHLPALPYVLQVSKPPETRPPARDCVSLWANISYPHHSTVPQD